MKTRAAARAEQLVDVSTSSSAEAPTAVLLAGAVGTPAARQLDFTDAMYNDVVMGSARSYGGACSGSSYGASLRLSLDAMQSAERAGKKGGEKAAQKELFLAMADEVDLLRGQLQALTVEVSSLKEQLCDAHDHIRLLQSQQGSLVVEQRLDAQQQRLQDLSKQMDTVVEGWQGSSGQRVELLSAEDRFVAQEQRLQALSLQVSSIVEDLQGAARQKEEDARQRQKDDQSLRDRSVLVKVGTGVKIGSSSELAQVIASAAGVSESAIAASSRIPRKGAPASFAAAVVGSSSNRGSEASTSDSEDGLYKVTFLTQHAARRVLFARKQLKIHGYRVDELLTPEQLAMKRAYLAAGVPQQLWREEQAVTSWRKGQLVKLLKDAGVGAQRWVPVELPGASSSK